MRDPMARARPGAVSPRPATITHARGAPRDLQAPAVFGTEKVTLGEFYDIVMTSSLQRMSIFRCYSEVWAQSSY
jgi:hypothetical protein